MKASLDPLEPQNLVPHAALILAAGNCLSIVTEKLSTRGSVPDSMTSCRVGHLLPLGPLRTGGSLPS